MQLHPNAVTKPIIFLNTRIHMVVWVSLEHFVTKERYSRWQPLSGGLPPLLLSSLASLGCAERIAKG